MLQNSKCAHVFVTLALFSGIAKADLSDWVNAVAAGSPSSFVSTTVVVPSVVDIGTLSQAGGLTYEFLVNADNTGISSAIMGAKNTGFGTNSALKFEQWSNTNSFGVTLWGIADWTIAPNLPNQDTHVTFVVDSASAMTELFVDGVSMGTAPNAPFLTNLVGLGQWYDPAASVDPLTGTIYGFAVYESILPAAEVLEHATAFHSTLDPGSAYCFGDATGGNCPCSAFGAPGQGCANTTGMGATMTGSGIPSVALDTFQLDIVGVPGAKPGLILRGDSQIVIPAGDGILCTTGNTQRSHVQITSAGATTFTNFNGAGFGSVSTVGAVTNFQFWYRDPSNTCSGAGFNFTNAWAVTYQP